MVIHHPLLYTATNLHMSLQHRMVNPQYGTTSPFRKISIWHYVIVGKNLQMALQHRLVKLTYAATSPFEQTSTWHYITVCSILHLFLEKSPYRTTSPFGETTLCQYITIWTNPTWQYITVLFNYRFFVYFVLY